MPSITVLNVPLPRVVVGVPRGGRRGAEAHGIIDDFPLPVRSVTDGEAPVFLRMRRHYLSDGMEPFRLLDGVAYRPVAWDVPHASVPVAGMDPELLAPKLVAHLRYEAGLRAEAAHIQNDPLANWRPLLAGIGNNGLSRAADKAFRDVTDDGRGRQAEIAGQVAGHILLVDGLLYARTPLPWVTVSATVSGDSRYVTSNDVGPRWNHGSPWRPGWNAFPPHRESDIEAYGAHLAAALDTTFDRSRHCFEILDRDAMEAAYAWTAARRARHMAANAVEAGGKVLAGLDDAGVRAWMSLRAAAAAPADPDPASVMDDVAALGGSASPGNRDLVAWDVDDATRLAIRCGEMARLQDFMAAREAGLDEEDDLSLSSLGPG